MVERLKERRVLSRTLAVLIGGPVLAGCVGSYGYGAGIEECREGDDTGVEVTMGSGDKRDPWVVLAHIKEHNAKVPTDEEYHDGASSRGLFHPSTDVINRLGEAVCTNADGDDVFTPLAFEASETLVVQVQAAEELR